MKQIILIMLMFLLAGCDLGFKQDIVLKCREGVVVLDLYRAYYVERVRNIKYPENLVVNNYLYLDENDKPMKCIEEIKWK